ncbi:TetR family transcriptional regulator [Caulobacter sp. SLTY]|uniref:TetR/AcrR family transcriptional regulator n=1 Tax=Caulobacter sp. SLTY TaxID=2683262 RepID=UPI0014126D4A|nr:TetR/AcrR family transcriptional regulator [Caulobacter sp. SLTY]NBB16996.1 TetR family transcriptional regulator [Caulobacter sp. SLTY]
MTELAAPETPATTRFAARRESILAAATGILNRQGVKGMTLADVAAEVGLITTSVTYYFRRKEDLAAACFLRGIESFEGLVRESAKAPDARARLDLFLELFFDLSRRIRRKEAPPMVSFSEMRSLKEPHRAEVGGAFADMFRRVRGFFDAPEFAGLSRAEANARTHLLLEQAFWTFTWLRRYDIEDYPRLRERMSDILTGGLAARSRSWTPPALGPLTEDGDQTAVGDVSRATFLTAATRLINQKGYRGASVEDISAALNVTKGSFYHHNEDKDELVVACFQRTFAVLRAAQLAARDLPVDQWTRLAATASALTEFQLSEEGPLLRGSAMGALPVDIRHEMSDRYARVSDRFAGMVADGIAEGSIRPVDPLVAAHMLNALLNAATSLGSWVTGLERSEASQLFVRPLMLGLFTR